MPPPSLFRRPVRQTLATIGHAQTEFPVRTDDELRNAIGTIAARGSSGDGTTFGARITIVGPILASTGYVIPTECGGMQITAAGFTPIIPTTPIAVLFTLNARAVRLSSLLVEASGATNVVTTFLSSDASSAQHLCVDHCIINADKFIVDTGGKLNGSRMHDNLIADVTTASVAVVESGSTNVRYYANTHTGTHASNAVLLDATGGAWSIIGNDCNSRGIDTSASTFDNVISSNILAGTILRRATDAVGLNT